MAIIPGIPDLKATILVRGEQAEEYVGDEEDEAGTPVKQVTRYITSEEGADFAIKWEYDSDFPFPNDSLVIRISIDGKTVECYVQHAWERRVHPTFICKYLKHEENGVWKCRDLKFGKLITRKSLPENMAFHLY